MPLHFQLLGLTALLAIILSWPRLGAYLSSSSILYFNDQYSYLAPLHWIEHPLITIIGITLLIISMIWIIVAQIQMGISWRIGIDSIHKTELKTNGLFSLSRNPFFLGMKLNILGFFLTLPNAVTFAIWVTGIAIIDIQVSLEEAHLRQLHGSAYDKYANRVGRWITFSHGPRP